MSFKDVLDPTEHCIKLEKPMVFPSSLPDSKVVRYIYLKIPDTQMHRVWFLAEEAGASCWAFSLREMV